jgi:5-histidylcysteine sulfoxide synthase/putative 4-mercaptohistidine N1-methyltranferase
LDFFSSSKELGEFKSKKRGKTMKNVITKTIILNSGEPEQKREEILFYFHKTYDIDEKLYEVLKNDSTFYLRADSLRHPLIFYYGHTAVFFINKLILAKLIDERINPKFESMFAVGVDEMSWDDLNEAHYDWPTVAEVKEYRDKVREKVADLIKTMPLSMPIDWNSPFWVMMMGIEHERIHLETSSVLIRQLPLSELQAHSLWQICPESGIAPKNKLIPVKGGKVELGKSKDCALYGWDNEFGKHEAEISDFQASKYLVSNQEFLEFVEEKGYETEKWWTEEGRNWRNYKQAVHPFFWHKEGDSYFLRTMLKLIPMPWDWPVVVNYLEAKAFCNWKAAKTGLPIRMPTENEWQLLRNRFVKTDQPYWEKAPGNINLEYWASSCPVNRFAFGDFYDIIGNVWQWTESPIYPFPGFEVHPVYDDFTVPTYDGRHNLFKGGSWISTGNEATKEARYAFRRHFFQHAGFRYISSDEPVILKDETYENDVNIANYCDMQYGKKKQTNFSVELIEKIKKHIVSQKHEKALHIGCKAGRTSFELARYFDSVMAVDFTARMIQIPTRMKEQGFIRYILHEEGELESFHEQKLSDFQLEDVREKVEFMQADPSNLTLKFNGYDLILVENALEEMYQPEKFLKMIHERLNENGMLVIATTAQWDEKFTQKKHWLGGFREDGEPVWTEETIRQILSMNFSQLDDKFELSFNRRVNQQKHERFISQITVWSKK